MSLGAMRDAGIGALLDPASPVRRYYAELAENILSLEERVRSLVVTSPEAGAGCSSVCVGLGAALVGMSKRVAVVDCNLDRPNLHLMLGEPNFIGLTSALQSGRPLENYGRDLIPGLLAVPTGPVSSDPAARVGSDGFVEAVRNIGAHRDIVILDAPVAERVLESPVLSSRFDGVLLVIHASRTSKRTAREVTDDLLDAGVNLLGVVLNGFEESA